ncbi:MAG: hypothetical protein IKZ41_05210 [Clostridia bacterium]|nr:hypothetical protein [Clostridia bacterium]MBR5366969.1 hypothetical protein [Clostridia bacterium]
MSEKPILFNTEMVRAILDGRKTQTRRIIKKPPGEGSIVAYNRYYNILIVNNIPDFSAPIEEGDVLWVRETWAAWSRTYGSFPKVIYKADENPRNISDIEWRPSIHMPRDLARIFLRVTGVRAERLQKISGSDCVAEGCDAEMLSEVGEEFTRGVFHGIWDSTIKKKDLPRCGWDANPWVWVYEFERIEGGAK